MTTLIKRSTLSAALLGVMLGLVISTSTASAQNQNGTWVQDNSGNWSNPSNWLSGVADGATFTADFSTINITAARTVTLDSSRTIGQLLFRDNPIPPGNTTPDFDWTLANSGGAVLTLDNGASQPVIKVLNRTATISAVLAGTNGVILTGGPGSTLVLAGNSTYSGGTVINSTAGTNSLIIRATSNNAFGTGLINLSNGTANQARIELGTDVVINNDIILNTINSGAGDNGVLRTQAANSATLNGTITVNAVNTSSGSFRGPNPGAFTPTGSFLIVNGAVNLGPDLIAAVGATTPKNKNGGSGSGAIVVRAGQVRLSGGGNYFRIEERAGALQVGATNGIATTAYVDIGGNIGNPNPFGVLDLNGFNQSLMGVSNYVNNGTAATITSSSTTSAATLTLTPANPITNPNLALLVFTAGGNGAGGGAVISDASASAPLNIVVNGDAAGVQFLTTANGSYRGTTTLTSGTLAVSSLTNGGSNSSIGASSNAASNLVFNGGTLRYVNSGLNSSNGVVALTNSTTPSTDRNFTINNGSSGTIDVASSGTTLTMSGGSAATTGSLTKAGAGTLILTGTNSHTGGTTVSAGTLRINSPGMLAGNVSVANLATLGGTGTIAGTVTPASGGIVAPGGSIGTLTVGGLTLNTGANVDFEFPASPGANDQITVSNAGGLAVNGGGLHLYQDGTTTAYSTNGTYTLFNINGGFSGALSNLTVLNPVAGKSYALSNSPATGIQLAIGTATTRDWTNTSGSFLWTTGGAGGNWNGTAFPNAVGETASFGTLGSGGSVDMNGSKTISGLIFDGFSSYTISGSGTLTLNNGVAAAPINVNNGSHTISVPVSLSNGAFVSFSNDSSLTIGGAVSGGTPLIVSGNGQLTLTGSNSYSTTSLSGATTRLNVGTLGGSDTTGSLGTGNVTMSGGATLNFNRSNAYSFGGAIAGAGSGAGSVNQLGSGSTTVTGAISNVTTVNVQDGSLVASSTINQTGGLNVTGNGGILSQGTGSLTANGAISGAGALNVNTTGTVSLNADNTYTGGTVIAGGTVVLNSANALPASSSLTVNGGILDLNTRNISVTNFGDTILGGVITNNGAAASTSTITFSGAVQQSYNLFAALNDGASGGKVAVTTSILQTDSNVAARVLFFNSTGTYSGGTTVTGQSIQAMADNAFGTGPITINANNASTNSSAIYLGQNVTIGNNITIAQGNPRQGNPAGVYGVIQAPGSTNGPLSAPGGAALGAADSTVNGTITILANNFTDGLFNGPPETSGFFLNINGAVNTAGTADTIIQIGGAVKYSGGGSYPNFQVNGTARLGANNGLAQNAIVQLSATSTGTASTGTFDLGGFDQTVVALSATSGTLTSIVQNSGAGTNTLTLNTTGTNNFNGTINGNVNLVVAGSGTQRLTGTNSGYTGVTTIGGTAGGTAVLEAASLAPGSSPSSIGASSNAAGNLVFDGGILRYTGTSTNTDRGFTINADKTATIDVAAAGTNLTWTGSSGASTGGLTKLGPGILMIDSTATHGYTGATTINAGTLVVNNALTSTSSISIASGAFLTGSGSIGGTITHTAGTINPGVIGGSSAGTFTFTGAMTLNGGTVQYDVDGSNLATPALQDLVKANGGLSITGPTTIDLEFLIPGSPPASAYDYTLFTYNGAAPSVSNLNFITNVAGRNTYTPSATAGQVKVHVVPGLSANLNWNSNSSGVWDVNSTANWFNTGAECAR